MKFWRAFTLVELLVVIAIISILSRTAAAGLEQGQGHSAGGGVPQQPETMGLGDAFLRRGA